MMKNERIISELINLEDHKESFREKKEMLDELKAEIWELQHLIHTLNKVDEVYNGVAIEIWDFGGKTIQPVDRSIIRSANVYQNAHNGWTWGLNLHNYHERGREKWFGACYPDYDEVMKFAKDWVVDGTDPKYEAFHTLDEVLEK